MSVVTPVSGPKPPGGLLAEYQPPVGTFDELVDGGVIRPHWQQFASSLSEITAPELLERWEQARRVIRENGVTYNVHGDPAGMTRPWELDALPLLVQGSEWNKLSAGLTQRATLLNLILADLYGQQRLLAEGLLPPELVLAHPGFLRPCHGLSVPRSRYLYIYAGHLARDNSGNWMVMADRARGPTGAGYALENRIVISRMLPDVFRDAQVERLAKFFLTFRETLQAVAHAQDNPRIVLLTPGPASPTYFEDAYIARYLGFALVEGGDLTVRDDHVYLKTLGGLLKVDVILRRLRDEECDPLELRGDSLHGIPGLVHAARSGHVVLANALGCSVLESHALIPFLPTLARYFLREDLLLPSVRTWWCGDGESLQLVLDNLQELVIKPSFPGPGLSPIYGARLTKEQLSEWRAKIKCAPQNYVAQELVSGSTAPVWNNGVMGPSHVAVRTFAVAKGDSYEVMPGGLARVSTTPDALGESALGGQGSKDVWVLADSPVTPVTLLHPAGTPVVVQRSSNDLPSRVADNLYWLGRHVERAESSARILRSFITRYTSESGMHGPQSLGTLLHVLAELGQLRPEFMALPPSAQFAQLESELIAGVFDPKKTASIASMLSMLRRTAATVRDRISIDSWRILNRLGQEVLAQVKPDDVPLADVLSILNRLILDISAFSGMGTESMTRGPGWRFLDMGRRLERSLHGLILLKSTLAIPAAEEDSVFEALLEIADSSMTYRSRYLTTLQLPPLLDLLITDETNPRAIAFQLAALGSHVDALPRSASQLLLTSEQRIVLSALTDVRLSDVYALAEVEKDGHRRQLEALLARSADQLRALSDEITRHYLIHAGPSRQMNEIRPSGRLYFPDNDLSPS
ncbi:protein of unknown function DUF404 [Pirellula staleyi DSM 6068]|uniref:Uncharacterized protein n=1 Tax=Pirellula staleyi (strain ATCC 27377 / DSM 6068 / ICPB 4128) TaxID=530564 RepID=D2R7T8_PIRSD|nr:circularly permuted type 2 ATP-grasp protein [Pirellula staleyi]ADB17514.1 protein of unknown function DUF404 [Pirellula staleyi DSM 6068]